MSMGTWKTKKLKKEMKGRANSTVSGKARLVVMYPPPQGWPGGRPEDNGYRKGVR